MTDSGFRIEKDSMGEVSVPSERLWGAQTQRSLENFGISAQPHPPQFIHAIAEIKSASARANAALGRIPAAVADEIKNACDRIISGEFDSEFPLPVWQTGSGTQTNMNVNEVIAHLASRALGAPVHPNDHVNRSQSTNDVYPTAIHMTALRLMDRLRSAVTDLAGVFGRLSVRHSDLIKTGRTHLQDAAPLTLGQEFAAWRDMLMRGCAYLESAQERLRSVPLGGTAVGTGLTAGEEQTRLAIAFLNEATGLGLDSGRDRFAGLSSKADLAFAHGAIKALAADLHKIANDVRFYSSGPRAGYAELRIPENEPGSSIMPGKVNPTQCEALIMVCMQVFGNDVTVGLAAASGNFQLNVCMPLILKNFHESASLLTGAVESFNLRCAAGIVPDEAVLARNLSNSLMTVTALVPVLGYDACAKAASHAGAAGLSLRESFARLGILEPAEFDRLMDYGSMVRQD